MKDAVPGRLMRRFLIRSQSCVDGCPAAQSRQQEEMSPADTYTPAQGSLALGLVCNSTTSQWSSAVTWRQVQDYQHDFRKDFDIGLCVTEVGPLRKVQFFGKRKI